MNPQAINIAQQRQLTEAFERAKQVTRERQEALRTAMLAFFDAASAGLQRLRDQTVTHQDFEAVTSCLEGLATSRASVFEQLDEVDREKNLSESCAAYDKILGDDLYDLLGTIEDLGFDELEDFSKLTVELCSKVEKDLWPVFEMYRKVLRDFGIPDTCIGPSC